MNPLTFDAPDLHKEIVLDFCKVPFVKTEEGLKFAHWRYDLNDTEEKREALRETVNGEEAIILMDKARADLETVIITDDDHRSWSIHKKEGGGVAQYHKILRDLSINLLMLNIDCSIDRITEDSHKSETDMYEIEDDESTNTGRVVLNRRNPFSDVTIKSQQYFYKTPDGETETLFFDTNNIIDKVDKNGRDLYTMRPGFSVTKEHGVAKKPTQNISFSNMMTEPIVSDDDNVYVYID